MKHFFKSKIAKRTALLLAVLVISGLPVALQQNQALAAANATLSLSPASQSVTVGSDVTLNIMLNPGSNTYNVWQASLAYSTSYFSSASVATAAGSPLTSNPGVDVASGGTIKIQRYTTSGVTYSGAVATVTLHSSAVGSTAVTFQHICTNSSDQTPCSSVNASDGSGTNVLGTITGGSYTINVVPVTPPATGGGTTSKPSTTTKKTATTTPATTTPATTQEPQQVTEQQNLPATGVVEVTVVDKSGKPVQNASVTVGDATGTTDKNGKVKLTGVSTGNATGKVTYKGKTSSFNVNVTSDGTDSSPQAVKFTIDAKNSSIINPITIGVAAVVIIAIITFIMIGPKKGMKGAGNGLGHHVNAPGAPVVSAAVVSSPKPVVQVPAPVKPARVPEPKSAAHATALHRLDPMEPGTVVRPNEAVSHATNLKH